jgi:hypothetical protein
MNQQQAAVFRLPEAARRRPRPRKDRGRLRTAQKLAHINDAKEARVSLLACLRLAEEFYQDGHYTFTVPENSISVAQEDKGWVASGKAVVSKGGSGEIKVTLTAGTPPKVSIEGKVRPDARPR